MPTQEQIVLQVNIQANTDRLRDLQNDLTNNKEQVKQLDAAFARGQVSLKEYNEMQVRLGQQAAQLRQEQTALTRANEAQLKINQAAAGSVDQLRAKSALLTSQWNALSKEARENTDAGKALAAELADVNEQIQEAGKKTKSFSSALLEAAKGNDALSGVVGRATGVSEKFTQAQGLARLALGGTATATNVLKVAMLALPIFLIVAALGALYTWLTKTQDGIDFVERKTKGLTTVLGVLTDKVSAVGKVLFDAFSNPKQALTDLTEAIGTNLLNRVKAFGVILEGILNLDARKLNDGILQFGTGVTDATAKSKAFVSELNEARKAGEAIAAENQRITVSERQINVERAQAKKQIEALKFIAEDVTKSTAERLAATQKAFELEQRSANALLKLQRERIANMEREQALTNNLDADNDALAEQKQKLAEMEEGSLTRQIELNNAINTIAGEGAAKQQALQDQAAKNAADALKRRIADTKALYERLAIEAEDGSAVELAARIKLIQETAKAELLSADLTANQRKLIEAKALQDVAQLQNDYAVKQRETEKKRVDDRKSETEREFEESKKLLDNYLKQQEAQAKIENLKGATTEEQYQDRLSSIRKAGLAAQKVIYQDYGQDIAALSNQVTDDQIADLERLRAQKDKDEAKEKARLESIHDSTRDFTASVGQAFGELLTQQTTDFEAFGKTLVLLILDTLEKVVLAQQAAALVQSLAQPDSVATFGATGVIRAGIITGLITAAFETAKGVITAGFAEGGEVRGQGTTTSDSIRAYGPGDTSVPTYRLSQGEHVLTAQEVQRMGGHGAVERLRAQYRSPGQEPIMTWLQSPAYGNKTHFATGGPVGQPAPPVYDGGYAQRAVTENSGIDYDRLADAMRKVILRPQVDVKTIKKSVEEYDLPRNLAKISSRK